MITVAKTMGTYTR